MPPLSTASPLGRRSDAFPATLASQSLPGVFPQASRMCLFLSLGTAMKLDMLGLEAFVTIVEYGSFQRAASALFITRAGLSRRLKNLESQLGVVLIERTTRSLRLSQVGIGFLPRAQRMLTEMNNAFHEIRDASRLNDAEVGVACLKSVAHHLLPQIISRYSQQFPGSRVRIIDGTSSEVTEAVLSKNCDVGIIVMSGPCQDLQSTPLTQDPFVLVCRDDNPLRTRRSIRLKDLENEPLILLNQSTASGLSFKHAIGELKLVLPRLYQVEHSTTALGLVNAGLGAAILPSLNLFRGVYPRIHAIPLVEPCVEREIGMIRRQDTQLTPAAEKFCDVVREVFVLRDQPGSDVSLECPPMGAWETGSLHSTH